VASARSAQINAKCASFEGPLRNPGALCRALSALGTFSALWFHLADRTHGHLGTLRKIDQVVPQIRLRHLELKVHR